MSAALFNGSARLPDLHRHRGFRFGDGVFRTCLIFESHVVDLEQQLDKVSADGRVLGLVPPPPSALRREARRLARGRRRGVLRIYLLRRGGGGGYRPVGNGIADRLLVAVPAPEFPARHWTSGVAVTRSSFRLADQPILAGIKHLNRLEQVLASRSTPARFVEALVNDPQGRPLEGTHSNLFWVRRGVLFTPRLDRCGVAGHLRGRVLDIARARRIPARQVRGSWRALLHADELFLCNSLIGIWPVRRLDRRPWNSPGPLTRVLMDELAHPRLAAA